MSFKNLRHRKGFISRIVLPATLACIIGGTLTPLRTLAAPDNIKGTWKDYNTITVTGSKFRGTINADHTAAIPGPIEFGLNNPPINTGLVIDDKPPTATFTTGAIVYRFAGSDLVSDALGSCVVGFTVAIFEATGNNTGWIYFPEPRPDGPQAGPGDGKVRIPPCKQAFKQQLRALLDGEQFPISGKRPKGADSPETAAEKKVNITVYPPDSAAKAPKNITLVVRKLDGTEVAKQTVPIVPIHEYEPGYGDDWPPDQMPTIAKAEFSLAPGEYQLCSGYVLKPCQKIDVNGTPFKKVKFIPLSLSFGKPLQTPDQKRISGIVEFHTTRPCGSALAIDPITVELTLPRGAKITKQTDAKALNPNPGEAGQICTVNVIANMGVKFGDMEPGKYKACTPLAEPECTSFTKLDGQEATFKLIIPNELVAPPDQPVCTSGEGIAGALAWIICPVVEAVAKATEFLETKIIVPFLTVSPLTTNNANPIYILWQAFRDFANVAFIILLFISIFSIALSKYGVKRLLPRLLLVAIGINLSYFVIALIIDAFNIFGAGISQLVIAALKAAETTQLNSGTEAGPVQSIFVLGGTALVAILIGGGAALGWLFGLLILAAIVVLVIVVVLVLRQIVIVTLVIFSPIAILLYLLPNTEQYFNKWRKMLIQLLLMYPMIVLLFAAGKIFGIILQQPGFTIAGDGVSEQVAEAVRVILQFLVYVIPLVFLPATFMASGSLMGKAYSFVSKRTIDSRRQRLGEDAAQARREAQLKMRGIGLRGDFIREQRRHNLQREQEAYVANAAGASPWLRRRAAGVSGKEGQTRAAAHAANVAAKGRSEDLQNEMSLLDSEMRRLGVDQKTFASWAGDYLSNPTNPTNQERTGSNGQTFNFREREAQLQAAYLNSAASQGEIIAIEAARRNRNIDQTLVDDIIRRNDGELKKNGGYHLATNFNLSADRMQVRDPATGALRTPLNDSEVRAEMTAQRLIAMSQSGVDSIADMKTGMMEDTAEILRTPGAFRDRVIRAVDQHGAAASTPTNYRAALRTQLDALLSPASRNSLARSDTNEQDFKDIRTNI